MAVAPFTVRGASFIRRFLSIVRVATPFAALLLAASCAKDEPPPVSPDVTPPGAVADLQATVGANRRITLTWTAPGDDGNAGKAARYEIRYSSVTLTEAAFDSAILAGTPIAKYTGQSETVELTGIPTGTWSLALKCADEVPNWSVLSNVVTATILPTADAIRPEQVHNLIVSATSAHGALLTWTAPGDDGMQGVAAQYDIRFSTEPITAETWGAATPGVDLLAPSTPGTEEAFLLEGLETGQHYFFALKTADEAPNWSEMSNVADGTIADVMEPSEVADLTPVAATGESVTFTWTATGNDDRSGRAAVYDLRYATIPINSVGWDAATAATGLPVPGEEGTVESFTVTGLATGQTYYFAIRAGDEVPNWSDLSNVAGATVVPWSLRRLTDTESPIGAYDASWSPDGEALVYPVYWNGSLEIYRIPAAGGSVVPLTNHPGFFSFDPKWSPVGPRIAFLSNQRGGKHELWTMASAGGEETLLAAHSFDVSGITWAPDGSRIAYVVTPEPGEASMVYSVPAAGGDPEILFEDDHGVGNLAWAPDGSRMALIRSGSENPQLWTAPIEGGPWISIGGSMADVWADPAWMPDGSQITFTRRLPGQPDTDIWSVPAETGATPALVYASWADDFMPAWSPDGTRLAFASTLSGKPEIWILQFE